MPNLKRHPSLKALKTFQEAGRHLSFKRAAEALFISPSAVSHQIRNLENFLGVELFVRKTRALEFTDAGLRYFAFLDEMFSRLEAETHQLFTEYGRGLIRLCVPPFFANEMLLPRLQSFQARMPDTDIRLTTQPSLMKAHPAEADLSVLLGKDEWPDLVTHRLFPRRLVVACAPSLLSHNVARAAVEGALEAGATDVLWIADKRGRETGVPAAKIAYVEVGSAEGDRRREPSWLERDADHRTLEA